MLSPKMQRTIRVNENQLIMLSERAHYDHSQAGYLHKRSADSSKWHLRWFVLYQVNICRYRFIQNTYIGVFLSDCVLNWRKRFPF